MRPARWGLCARPRRGSRRRPRPAPRPSSPVAARRPAEPSAAAAACIPSPWREYSLTLEYCLPVGPLDLNAEVGEVDPRIDDELIPLITSANIACGGHAGDAESMRRTVALARRHGVRV